MFNGEQLVRDFAKIGARMHITTLDDRWIRLFNFGLNKKSSSGEFFRLEIQEEAKRVLDFRVSHIDTRTRHAVMSIDRDWGDEVGKSSQPEGKSHVLIGHDERHWFLADLPERIGINSVHRAMGSLQPPEIQALRHTRGRGMPDTQWHRRRNACFKRQGEWFFVPVTADDVINQKLILRDGVLQRFQYLTKLNTHRVDELFRVPRQMDFYDNLNELWKEGVTSVIPLRQYARGRVRHKDHATIFLREWHEVFLNCESDGTSEYSD